MEGHMKLLGSFAVLFCLAVFLHAQETPATQPAAGIINVTDKAALEAAKGTSATIEGKVSLAEWSKSGKVMNIEFDGAPYFMGAVFERNRAKLDEAFGGDLTKALTGATVRITGEIAPYGGKSEKFKDTLQIILKTGNQLTVVTPAAESPATQPAQ